MSRNDEHDNGSVHAAVIRLVGDLHARPADIEQVLTSVTRAAVAHIGGIHEAGVMLIEAEKLLSVTATAPLASEVGHLQQQAPRITAALAQGLPVRCTDLRQESRWPDFAAAAIHLGVRSMLSFPLHTHHGQVGVLNLLGLNPHVFTPEAEALAATLTAYAGLALSTITQHHDFDSALRSRDTIGQAKGILMERHGLDAAQAFALLKRHSQETNTRLRDVAAEFMTYFTPPVR